MHPHFFIISHPKPYKPNPLIFQTENCIAYKPGHNFKDLKQGCTGKITKNDLLVKGWLNQDKPQGLHLWCGKREWQKKVYYNRHYKKYVSCTPFTYRAHILHNYTRRYHSPKNNYQKKVYQPPRIVHIVHLPHRHITRTYPHNIAL